MTARSLTRGAVLDEFGFRRLDPSLGNALKQVGRLLSAAIAAIGRRLTTNASV